MRSEDELAGPASVALHARARTVGRQVQPRGRTCELLGPVVQQLIQMVSRKLIALPASEVCVLDGKVGKRWLGAVPHRAVQLIELGEQQCAGGMVRRDVVENGQEQILVLVEMDQPSSQRDVARQIKAPACQIAEDALAFHLSLEFGPRAQIGNGQLDLSTGRHLLRRHSVDYAEAGA